MPSPATENRRLAEPMRSGHRSPAIRAGFWVGLLCGALLLAAGPAAALCEAAPAAGEVWAGQFSRISGSGDWATTRVGPAPGHLEIVAESQGLLSLGCNGNVLDPASGVLAATVMNRQDVLVQSGELGGDATLGMQEMQQPGVNYDTPDVAAAFFPYAAGWTAGRFDATGSLTESNPAAPDPNAPIITRVGLGDYTVELPGVSNSYTDGMLYAIVDGLGENYVNTRALDPSDGSPGSGRWSVAVRDNQANVRQDHPVRFVFLPWTPGTVYGRVGLAGGSLNLIATSGGYTVQRIGTGEVRLDLTDASPEEGMLLMMGGNDFGVPDDNLYRYDTDEDDDFRRFVMVNRDQPPNQNAMEPQDTEFLFTYIPFAPHVIDENKLASQTAGGPFDPATQAGVGIARLGDLDGDGIPDQAVASGTVGAVEGEVQILFMNADGSVKSSTLIRSNTGGFDVTLAAADRFGDSVAFAGDVDNDGVADLVVGAPGRNGDSGSVWVLLLTADGSVKSSQELSNTAGGFAGGLVAGDLFGSAVAGLGDLDGDFVPDLVVGARGDSLTAGSAEGAAWIVFLEADGSVKGQQKIGNGVGGFGGTLAAGDAFGSAAAALGDITGDGLPDVAIGAPDAGNDVGDGLVRAGAIWLIALNADGTVASENEIELIDATGFDFSAQLARFGSSLSALGDLNGDGTQDLAVGGRTANADSSGFVYIVYLDGAMGVSAIQRVGEQAGGLLDQTFGPGDNFGVSVAALADLDGDGVTELSVGQSGDAGDEGAVWTLSLAGVAPMCADGVLDPAEACDDGSVVPGDGCSTTCTLEDRISVSGLAQGGEVMVALDGTVLTIPTFAGQAPFVISNNIAAAINNNPALAGAGVYGADEFLSGTESLVWSNGRYGGVMTTDPGLVVVPEPGFAMSLLAAGGLLAALGRRSRGDRSARAVPAARKGRAAR